MPASTAEIVNATVRTVSGLTASDAAATSESRTARIARPHALRARRLYSTSTIPMSAIATSAMPRSPSDSEPTAGYGMFIRPFWPPVSPSHSTTLYSTTNPNAIVTIAR